MHWQTLLGALCLVSATAHAQVWRPDVPQTAHSWPGADAGAAIDGSTGSTRAVGALGVEIGSLVGPHTVLMVDGMLLLPPTLDEATCRIPASGDVVCRPPNDLRVDGVSGNVGRAWAQTGGTPRFIAYVGAGGYRVNGVGGVATGVDASLKWSIADWGHVGVILAAQGILLPNVAGTRVWIIPITLGLRRH